MTETADSIERQKISASQTNRPGTTKSGEHTETSIRPTKMVEQTRPSITTTNQTDKAIPETNQGGVQKNSGTRTLQLQNNAHNYHVKIPSQMK